MPTRAFEAGDSRAKLADWLELKALLSASSRIGRSALVSVTRILGEDEHSVEFDEPSGQYLEDEILEPAADALDQAVYEELEYRSVVLGELYPFDLGSEHGQWFLAPSESRDPSVRASHLAYLSCLLISCFRYKYIAADSASQVEKQIPDLMQQTAWYVAGTLVNGEAYWFGWPRPDQAVNFRDALQTIVERSGAGKLRDADPDWSTGAEKDGSVDIVAWRRFRDRRPGQPFLFGQVASGGNWRDKSVESRLDPDFIEWFLDRPTRFYIPAMFIPFTQHEWCEPKQGRSFEEQASANARHDERIFGVVVDRLRITELASEAREVRRPDSPEWRRALVNNARWIRDALQQAV